MTAACILDEASLSPELLMMVLKGLSDLALCR